jgi:hypothetical protein
MLANWGHVIGFSSALAFSFIVHEPSGICSINSDSINKYFVGLPWNEPMRDLCSPNVSYTFGMSKNNKKKKYF